MEPSDPTTGKKTPRRWGLWVLAGAVALLALGKVFVIDVYTVPQQGMFPGIYAGGRFFGWKRPYADPSEVRRGDVVVFVRRLDDGKSYQFVWRVAGLPGDRVEVAGDSVRVNGRELGREPVRTERGAQVFRETNDGVSYEVAYSVPPTAGREAPAASLTVPPGEFFVLGDNRHHARDSRYDGTVPFEAIVARKL